MPCVPWMESIFQSDVGGVLLMDVEAAGSTSDAEIFKHSNLRQKIEDGSISFPESDSLGIGGPKVNFCILGDDIFPLKLWLMKPYSDTVWTARRGSSTTGSAGEAGWSKTPLASSHLALGYSRARCSISPQW